ncbi:MAG: hypothetical protein H6868_01920 [Rhodospirillales bacterium]|nr:hypothetical protein [Rhodospirillales bacterium]
MSEQEEETIEYLGNEEFGGNIFYCGDTLNTQDQNRFFEILRHAPAMAMIATSVSEILLTNYFTPKESKNSIPFGIVIHDHITETQPRKSLEIVLSSDGNPESEKIVTAFISDIYTFVTKETMSDIDHETHTIAATSEKELWRLLSRFVSMEREMWERTTQGRRAKPDDPSIIEPWAFAAMPEIPFNDLDSFAKECQRIAFDDLCSYRPEIIATIIEQQERKRTLRENPEAKMASPPPMNHAFRWH